MSTARFARASDASQGRSRSTLRGVKMSDTWAPTSTPTPSGASRRVTARCVAARATGMSTSPSARDGASASRASTAHHSLPALWKHAMRHYGRYQGYAWTTVLCAGGLAYALSVVLPKQTSTTSDDGKSAAASDDARARGR